jgi:hypothetical protein
LAKKLMLAALLMKLTVLEASLQWTPKDLLLPPLLAVLAVEAMMIPKHLFVLKDLAVLIAEVVLLHSLGQAVAPVPSASVSTHQVTSGLLVHRHHLVAAGFLWRSRLAGQKTPYWTGSTVQDTVVPGLLQLSIQRLAAAC